MPSAENDAPTRTPGPDMRFPGERYCADCPDTEGCFTGYPCDLVRRVISPART